MDVVNNEEPRVGDQKQQHQRLLVRLLGKHLSHAALENMDLSTKTVLTSEHCLAPKAKTRSVKITENLWKRIVASEA